MDTDDGTIEICGFKIEKVMAEKWSPTTMSPPGVPVPDFDTREEAIAYAAEAAEVQGNREEYDKRKQRNAQRRDPR